MTYFIFNCKFYFGHFQWKISCTSRKARIFSCTLLRQRIYLVSAKNWKAFFTSAVEKTKTQAQISSQKFKKKNLKPRGAFPEKGNN